MIDTKGLVFQPISCAIVRGKSYLSGGSIWGFLMGDNVSINFTASSYSFLVTMPISLVLEFRIKKINKNKYLS
jgi:hypothetical protein